MNVPTLTEKHVEWLFGGPLRTINLEDGKLISGYEHHRADTAILYTADFMSALNEGWETNVLPTKTVLPRLQELLKERLEDSDA